VAWALIANPQASRVSDELIAAVEAPLPHDLQTIRTTRPGEATELARDLDGDVEAIVAFGGDGTFNEVLNGVDGASLLGFLPGGGTSVLPRALGLPRDPVAAAHRLAATRTRRIGLGRVNGRRFGFNAGIGFDAELVRAVDELGRRPDGRRPGDRAFGRAALRLTAERRGRFEPALEIEGLGRAAFALVANCTPYTYLGRLGLRVTPDASFEGGIDLAAPARITLASLPRLAYRAYRGGGGRGLLTAHDADRLVVHCDEPMPLQVDGEDVGDVVDAVFEAERDAVAVLV
jgi:diacylglycerol kinase family enzyme